MAKDKNLKSKRKRRIFRGYIKYGGSGKMYSICWIFFFCFQFFVYFCMFNKKELMMNSFQCSGRMLKKKYKSLVVDEADKMSERGYWRGMHVNVCVNM